MQNKREFFRLEMYTIDVEVKIGKEKFKGAVRDVSGNGISFILEEDINFKECDVKFQLKKETFNLHATFIRKDKKEEQPHRIVYACTFNELKDREKGRISSILLQMDAIRRKKDLDE